MFVDQYPGKPKILFIGNSGSSHVQGWIELLKNGEFNIRLFSCTADYPRDDWKVQTYLITKYPPMDMNTDFRQSWWPVPKTYPNKVLKLAGRFFRKIVNPRPKVALPEKWLSEIIRSWQPDIVHAVGLEEGVAFYLRAMEQFPVRVKHKLVFKVFGGSDVALKIFDNASLKSLADIFSKPTHVLFDNSYYPGILVEKNVLSRERICPLTPTPGSGGVDVEDLSSKWPMPASKRRLIVWPKSYETLWSKALPVLFALREVWDRIQPCEVYMLATNPEVKQWISTLPDHMVAKLHVFTGVPRSQAINIMLQSRLLLAPSLIDGVPNVLYEAMACGAVPIVSPIPTIKAIVDEKNVIFAENLEQTEIEQALIRGMTNDAFVDDCSKRNVELARNMADIKIIQPRLIAYYQSLAGRE